MLLPSAEMQQGATQPPWRTIMLTPPPPPFSPILEEEEEEEEERRRKGPRAPPAIMPSIAESVSEQLEAEDIASLPTLQHALWQIDVPGAPPVLTNFAALFRINSLLGSGGFGATYLVQSRVDGAVYAMKVLLGDVEIEVLANEVAALRHLARTAECHQVHVVCYYGVVGLPPGTWPGDLAQRITYALLIEYIPGPTLDQFVESNPMRAIAMLPCLATQLLEAVQYLHALGYAHHDIKPNNIILRRPNDLVLIDFGLACLRVPAMRPEPFLQSPSCASAATAGTLGFLPPEVAAGIAAQIDAAAGDMFAIGVTLYYILTQALPPRAGARVPRGGSFLTAVDPCWIRLIDDLLRPDPAARPTAQEALARTCPYDCEFLPVVAPSQAVAPPSPETLRAAEYLNFLATSLR